MSLERKWDTRALQAIVRTLALRHWVEVVKTWNSTWDTVSAVIITPGKPSRRLQGVVRALGWDSHLRSSPAASPI